MTNSTRANEKTRGLKTAATNLEGADRRSALREKEEGFIA